ncbi:hypothetical protein ACTXT7_017223 [Hymenolepis weldensis]
MEVSSQGLGGEKLEFLPVLIGDRSIKVVSSSNIVVNLNACLVSFFSKDERDAKTEEINWPILMIEQK